MRSSLFLLATAALVGCQSPTADVTLSTTGGHIVDSRSWAVGSRLGISASWNTGDMGQISFQTASGESLIEETPWWRGELGAGPSMGSGYASRTGVIERAGDFDVVVLDTLGRELLREPLAAAEVDEVRLGVALDDCPEFADVVVPDGAAFLAGTELMVYPAPVDADGNHLLGGLDFDLTTSGVTLPYGGYDLGGYLAGYPGGESAAAHSYPVTVALGDGGSVGFEIAGASHEFSVRTVLAEDIVGLGIDAQAEKHGYEGESLLTVFGVTADGVEVHGVRGDWSGGWASSTWIHAQEGEEVDVCFAGLCATWAGALSD